jgi:sugar-specific transcriptional regulator TrmB
MNDAIEKLTQCGFSAYEAKAYLALLKKSPAIGYEVSKIAGVPTAKIYETLLSLKNKGIILSSTSEPVFYYPIDPDMLLKRIHMEFDEKMKSLSGLLTNVSPIPDIDITWNLTGRRAVIEKVVSVIQKATRDLLVSLWPKEAEAVKEQLVAAEHRGVRVIAGIFGAYDPGCTYTVNLESCGESSQKRLGKRLNVLVGDSKEAVISEMNHDEDALGIWATTPCIILTAKEYIKHDIWGKALIDEVGKERFDNMIKSSEILSYLIQNR